MTKHSSFFLKLLKSASFTSFGNPFVLIDNEFNIKYKEGDLSLYLKDNDALSLSETLYAHLLEELTAIIGLLNQEKKESLKSKTIVFLQNGSQHCFEYMIHLIHQAKINEPLYGIIFNRVDLGNSLIPNKTQNAVKFDVEEQNTCLEVAHYKLFIEESLNAFIQVKEDGTILKANEAALKMFGYNVLVGLKCTQLVISDEIFDQVLANKQQDNKILGYGIKESGEHFPIEYSCIAFTDNKTGNKIISKIIRDVTEGKKIEQMLEDTNKVGRIGGWELNFFDNSIFWSKVTKEIHEVPPDYIPTVENAIHFYKEGYSRNAIKRLIEEAIQKGNSFDAELQIITHKGNKLWVRAKGVSEFRNGQCMRVYGIFQDISEQRQIQQQLAISQQEYMSLYEQNPSAVFSVNLQGHILSANDAFAHKVEYSKDEILNKKFSTFIHADDLDIYHSYYEAAKRGIASEGEIRVISNNGLELILFIVILPIVVNNKITGVYGIANDISESKRSQLAIEKVKNDLTKIISTSQDIICTIDKEGKFVLLNNAAEQILGYTTSYLTGKPFLDFVFVDDVKETEEMANKIYAGYSVSNYENRYIRKNGTLVPLSWSARWDSNDELMYCVARDVTDKKRQEEEIIKSNERFEYATQATFDAIWDWDLVGNLIYWGSGFKTLFGYNNINEFVSGDIWKTRIHKDDYDELMANQQLFIQSSELNWTFEYRYLKADGTYAHVLDKVIAVKDSQGNTVRMIGAMQNLTKQKQEEYRLKLLESVITNAKDGVIITETDNRETDGLKIIYVNNALCEITGYTKEELIGKSPKIFQGINTDRNELNRVGESLKKWEPVEAEVINYTKAGVEFWMNFSIVPIANETGYFTHWIAIERDVTARKKAEEEKEHLLKELTQNNKELKQFSYITSHNMRAPLTNLLAIFDILDTSKIQDMETLVLLDAMKTSTNHLNDTLNDLIKILIIKENTSYAIEEIYFSDTLRLVTKSIDSLIKNAKVKIKSNFSKAEKVNFNKSYLESIFLNMLTNAIKYAHPDRAPQISITATATNDTIQLVFADNGLGFDIDKVKGKIFGLYQKFHNHPDSKGIGLYLVYSQVVSLGGNIKVESKIDVGTTFTITFLN